MQLDLSKMKHILVLIVGILARNNLTSAETNSIDGFLKDKGKNNVLEYN